MSGFFYGYRMTAGWFYLKINPRYIKAPYNKNFPEKY